jgi:hypothetical protein
MYFISSFQTIQQDLVQMLEKHKKHENRIAIWDESMKRLDFKG